MRAQAAVPNTAGASVLTSSTKSLRMVVSPTASSSKLVSYSLEKLSRNMSGPPAPWHAAPMALSAATRSAVPCFVSRTMSRSIMAFSCESCLGSIDRTGIRTILPSRTTVIVPAAAAALLLSPGSLCRTLTATSPGAAPVAGDLLATNLVACTSPHASSRASSASRTTGTSSLPSRLSLLVSGLVRYLLKKWPRRYRLAPCVGLRRVLASEPMSHGLIPTCAGMPCCDEAKAWGSSEGMSTLNTSNCPLRWTGRKTSSITLWSWSVSLTVQMNTAVFVDLM